MMRQTGSDSAEDTKSVFLDEVGMTAQESIHLRFLAVEAVSSPKSVLSRKILELECQETSIRIAQAFRSGWLQGFSKIGQYWSIQHFRDNPDDLRSLEWILTEFLVDPIVHPTVAAWCFHCALQESSATFQLDSCPSPTSEERLSGILLGEISGRCEAWTRVAAEPLKRTQASIALRSIDLSILGGEQATGGDFGIVLHFEGSRARQDVHQESTSSRIVPLIFQAKRYVRPTADISQRHHQRGFQYDMLSRNKCASAYIFYENGRESVELPLPPLIKPVDSVASAGRTAVLKDSLDLPSYLFRALYDSSFATPASSPEDALRMIHSEADIGQLSRLAVISDSATVSLHYEAALQTLGRDIEKDQDQSIGGLEL